MGFSHVTSVGTWAQKPVPKLIATTEVDVRVEAAAATAAPRSAVDGDIIRDAQRVLLSACKVKKVRDEFCYACWGENGGRGRLHPGVFVSTKVPELKAKWAAALGATADPGRAFYVCQKWLPLDFDPKNPRFELAAADGPAFDLRVDESAHAKRLVREQQKALNMAMDENKRQRRRRADRRRVRDGVVAELSELRRRAADLERRLGDFDDVASDDDDGGDDGDYGDVATLYGDDEPTCSGRRERAGAASAAGGMVVEDIDEDDEPDDGHVVDADANAGFVAHAAASSASVSPGQRRVLRVALHHRRPGAPAFCTSDSCPVCHVHGVFRKSDDYCGIDWCAIAEHDAALKNERSWWVPHLLTFRTLADVHAYARHVYTTQLVANGKEWRSRLPFFDALCLVLMRSRRAFAYGTLSFLWGTAESTVRRIVNAVVKLAGAYSRSTFGFGVLKLEDHIPAGHRRLIPNACLCFDSTYIRTDKPSDYTLQLET
jgi:hypothetical protein